ncbi:MAG: monovalent cation/H(+) antiporter subunit G [Pseudomonadota bacterium]
MNVFIDVVSWICILGGVFFSITGAFGVVRFPEFWTRLHASSVAESGGMILLVLGMCLQAGWGLVLVKLVLIGVFLFITGPTSTHAVANAALVSGEDPVIDDELKGSTEEKK